MDDSILNSVKKVLGLAEDYNHFDFDVIVHINSVFMILNQMGVGPEGFLIEDSTTTWNDFLQDSAKLESVKTYMYLKVRLMFDPPTSSVIMESMNRMISELEWRLNVAVDPGDSSRKE